MKSQNSTSATSLAPQASAKSSTDGSASADFRLLRYFATASLAAFVVVALLLGYVFRTLSVDALINGCQSEHVNHARIIANDMWAEQFAPLIQSVADQPDAQLPASPLLPTVHKKVLMLLDGTKIYKIKVYDLRGRTIYSTELAQIGENNSQNAGVMNGLRGHSSSELVHQNQISSFEGVQQDRAVIESYIPNYNPVTGQVSGVFEIYRDATSVLADVGRRQWLLVAAVVALLTLLYLAVFLIVKKAQNHIIGQNLARQKAQQALALSEERWKFALEGAGDGVWDRNMQTGAVVFSKRYKEIHGFAADELENHTEAWNARVHSDDLARIEADRAAYFAGDKPIYANERRMQCKDGSWKWILSRGMVVTRDALGQPLRMIGTHTDITDRHKSEEALRLASTVILTMDEAATVTNLRNEIISVNPAFTQITGYTSEDVFGKDPKLLASGTHSAEFYQTMWHQLASTDSWHGEICNRRKSGQIYLEWLSIKQVRNAQGVHTHYVSVSSDISERKAREEHILHLAHFEMLTGLPNRTLFSDRLRQAIARARREKTGLALMFIDLDKFKPVNDELGHQVGDLLLKEVAQRLLACVRRESDTVARVGGDEFVVILPELEAIQTATRVADKILAALARRFDIGAHPVHISSSIGIAFFPEQGNDEKQLMKMADAAMYQAKQNGRNQVAIALPSL
ncbi:sensor domain-containing diguanylate cyclase [Rhodoferax sp.]|uniref:sensor domain-containing diguanylate cyclase n=1 Tax=Rhodoferax sp. TaxID=50421 RepID=UPI0027165BA5|nr:sensor domain-containing diguanylate cyclase [Rhodoferax sp.]MDO8319601.1 diguanylate cyclase [Rhodoferax sp.]